MSGFAGIVRTEPTPETVEADRIVIARMAEAIAFRGPDAQHQFLESGAVFAFSLLTTGPAPQASTQPVTLDGEMFFLGEARLDGRDDLTRKLQQYGVPVLPSATDEDLLLRFVQRFGVEALPELDGDFSFVLWMRREGKLLAFRDISGARPFFYSCRNGKLIFSNTLQALVAARRRSLRDYDQAFIADFLLGAPYYDCERTIYSEVRRLAPGHLMEFSAVDISTRSIGAYPIEEPLSFRRDNDVVEQFRYRFFRAVRDRLPETETTILLSGGLDSTSVAAAAVRARNSQNNSSLKLSAFTLDFLPLFQDEEGALAQQFAASLNLPFELVHVAQILPCEGADGGPFRLPEPAPFPYPAIQPFYVSRFRADSRILFTGDGGDEILRGEGAPFLAYVGARSSKASAAWLFLRYVISRRRLPALGAGLRSRFLRQMGRYRAPEIFPPWFDPSFVGSFQLRERFATITAKPWSEHPYQPWSYAKLVRFIPPLMEGQDATFTGHALEVRSPFLDRRLLRFLLRLPPIPWLMEKEILRRSKEGVLPDWIRLRPKVPLQNDPLELHFAARKWSPRAPERCPSPLCSVVNWKRVLDTLSTAAPTELYVHLRPVLLALWLNAVENGHGIQ